MRHSTETPALAAWCETLLASGKFEDAETFARILHEDNEVTSLILLAKSLLANAKYDEAVDLLDAYFAHYTEIPTEDKVDIMLAKAKILASDGDNRPALKILRDARAASQGALGLDDQIKSIDYMLGSLFIKTRNFDKAQSVFRETFDISYGASNVTSSDIIDCAPLGTVDALPLKLSGPSVYKTLLNRDMKTKTDCVYFVSGDLTYCKELVPKLARQLASLTTGNVRLHIHGVITGEDDPGRSERAWNIIKDHIKELSLPLTFTLETLGLKDLTEAQSKALYACERFRQLPKLLSDYRLPVIAADLAQLPLHDPSQLLTDGHFDVALLSAPDAALSIVEDSPAGLAIFNPTEEAMRFAADLKSYVTRAVRHRHGLCPKLGQVSLAITKYKDAHTVFKALPLSLIETRKEGRLPHAAYQGQAAFIAKAADEDVVDFVNFLRGNAPYFTVPMMARAMGTQGHTQPALNMLERYLKDQPGLSDPEYFEIHQLQGLIHAHAGTLETSYECLLKAQAALSGDAAHAKAKSISLYQLGSAAAALGKTHEAQDIFDQNIPINCDNGWTTHTGIINLTGREGDPSTAALNTRFKSDISSDIETVYFVAANLAYCKKFAAKLVSEIGKLKLRKLHLHIHGVVLGKSEADAEVTDWAFLTSLLEGSDISVSFTTAHLDLPAMNTQQRKAVFSAERFRLLPTILAHYNVPVLVADIDQFPLKDFAGIVDKDFAAQILYFPKSVLNILSVVSATLAIFQPSEKGLELATALKSYFDRAYAMPETLDWHVDQAALASLIYTCPDAHIGHLPPAIVEKNPIAVNPAHALELGAYFWSVTNSISGNTEALERLQDRYEESSN